MQLKARFIATTLLPFVALIISLQTVVHAADDFGNTPATATDIPSTATIFGSIESSADVDYFRFVVSSKTSVRFALAPQAPGSGGKILRAKLLDSDMTELGETNFGSIFDAKPPLVVELRPATYYIRVGGDSLPYKLETRAIVDDHGNTRSDATPIALGSSASGTIHYPPEPSGSLLGGDTDGDVDYFSVFVPASGELYPSLDVYAQNGGVTVENARGLESELYYYIDAPSRYFAKVSPGRYYIRANARIGLRTYTVAPSFVSTGGSGPFDDYPSTVRDAAPIAIGSPTSGRIDFFGDVDAFRLDLTDAGSLRIDIAGPIELDLTLRDASFKRVEQTVVTTQEGKTVLFAHVDIGRIFTEVSARWETSPASYQVQLTFAPRATATPDDHSNRSISATPASLGVPVGGVVDYPGDVDVFRLVLETASAVTFRTSGTTELLAWVLTSTGLRPTAGGSLIPAAGRGDPGFSASLPAGVYYVHVAHSKPGSVGPYQLSASLYVPPPQPRAVEYFHPDFGHYFITASDDEIGKLDSGAFAGWARTGQSFPVSPLNAAGSAKMCRFFSTSFMPKSSHFYTPFTSECADVKLNRDWQFEAEVFSVHLPDTLGNCPATMDAVYRLYNNGQTGAPNHRYTTSAAIRDEMMGRGYVAEGVGSRGVVACVPR